MKIDEALTLMHTTSSLEREGVLSARIREIVGGEYPATVVTVASLSAHMPDPSFMRRSDRWDDGEWMVSTSMSSMTFIKDGQIEGSIWQASDGTLDYYHGEDDFEGGEWVGWSHELSKVVGGTYLFSCDVGKDKKLRIRSIFLTPQADLEMVIQAARVLRDEEARR